MRTILLALALPPLLACGPSVGLGTDGSGGSGSTTPSWTFTDEGPVSPALSGASPGATLLSDATVRLYVADVDGGTVYRSATDGRTFHVEATHAIPGTDPTVLPLPGGSWRMYYRYRAPGGTTQTIMTALSADGLQWSAGASTGIQDSSGSPAWGVPTAVRAPDGTTRLYWVSWTPGENYESVDSATSADGIVFGGDIGHRTTGGWVDPQIVKAEPGDWVALFSTSPALAPQKLYVGTSPDGLSWSVNPTPVHALPGRNVVDPASVRLDPARNVYRVYYAASQGAEPATDAWELRSGVLRGP